MDNQKPLEGRRLYFVGIGGSGMSAYANIARAWGAEVRGWDLRDDDLLRDARGDRRRPRRRARPTRRLRGDRLERLIGTGSTERSRADFLAELVASRPSIVVTGAHGKTTTAAMIAYALRETGNDPAWIVGGVVPQLGGNAGGGAGWLVVEGDESDRSVFALRPRLAVVTNVELDHHASVRLDVRARVTRSRPGSRRCPTSSAAGSSRRQSSRSPCRASTTGGTRPRRTRRSTRVGVEPDAAAAALGALRGSRPPLRGRRRARRRHGRRRLRRTTRPRSGLTLATARERTGGAARRALRASCRRAHAAPAPRARRRTRARRRRHRHRLRRQARRAAGRHHGEDWSSRRCRTRPGASGRRRSTTRPGSPSGSCGQAMSWSRSAWGSRGVPPGRSRKALRLDPSDRGGGAARPPHHDRHRRACDGVLPAEVARRARRVDRLGRVPVTCRSSQSGSARTCSRRTTGSTRSSFASTESWRRSRSTASCCVAGGGAPNAVCLHRARSAALGGLEFACAIPGTAGGGVRMNAGAYGSDWAEILARALVVSAAGSGWLTPAELGLVVPPLGASCRTGGRAGRVPAHAAAGRGDQGRRRGPRRAAKGDAADEQADVRVGVQEPDGRARRRPHARALRSQGPPDRRRAIVSPRHANFIENAGGATSADCARPDRRGAPAGARAVRSRARARGRAPGRGRLRRPRLTSRRAPKESAAAGANRLRGAEAPAAASVVVPFPRAGSDDRLALGPLVPSGRSLADRVRRPRLACSRRRARARETSLFAVRDDRGRRRAAPRRAAGAARARPTTWATSLVALDLDAARIAVDGPPNGRVGRVRPGLSPHAPRHGRPGAAGRGRAAGGRGGRRLGARPRDRARSSAGRTPRSPGSGSAGTCAWNAGAFVDGDLRNGGRRGRAARRDPIPEPRRLRHDRRTASTLRLRSGLELRLGDTRDVDLKLAVAGRVLPLLPQGTGYLDVSVPDRPVAGPPSLNSQVEVETAPSTVLEGRVDNADKESVPWLRMQDELHSP